MQQSKHMNDLPVPVFNLDSSSPLRHIFEKININKNYLSVLIGENNGPATLDFSKIGHLLIVGWSESQKEKVVDTMIQSILYSYKPEDVRFIIFDSLNCFYPYNNIPHLLTEVIPDFMKLTSAFKWVQAEVEMRLKEFRNKKVKNIEEFNQLKDIEKKPRIIFFINTLNSVLRFSDTETETLLSELINTGNKVGIHMVLVTDYIPKRALKISLLSNIPNRIICQLTNEEDSLSLGISDAHKLKSDEMYLLKFQEKPQKIKRISISDQEITKTVTYLKKHAPEVHYTEEVKYQNEGMNPEGKDVLFNQAVIIIKDHDKVSASLLQRRLSIGYARASRLLDQLESEGMISPAEGSKPRKVLKKG